MHTVVVGGRKGFQMPFGSALFTLIALAVVGYHSYLYLAVQAAEAEILAVRPYCQLITCNWGKCSRGERMACVDVPATLDPEQRVRRFQEARVEFIDRYGQRRAAWTEIGRGIQGGARVGDRVSVHFIDHLGGEVEVTNRPSLFLTVFGLAAFLFFLSIGARIHHSKWARPSS